MIRYHTLPAFTLLLTASACSSVLGLEESSKSVDCVEDDDCTQGQVCTAYLCVDETSGDAIASAASTAGAAGTAGDSSADAGAGGLGGVTNTSGGTTSRDDTTTAGGATTVFGTTSTGGTTSAATECTPATHQCYAYENAARDIAWQTCSGEGTWNTGELCADYCTTSATDGCNTAPSCNALNACTSNRSCCNSLPLPTATFNRSALVDGDGVAWACGADDLCPATVSAFLLDTFEVTVARFRTFVSSYPGSLPTTPGAGANANNAGDPGWSTDWNSDTSLLPASKTDLETALTSCSGSTYTTEPVGSDFLPLNCVNWYLAYAFCIWDGGRLPTEAEWDYAASGGEGRYYPWSSPADSSLIDLDYATYDDGTTTGPRVVGAATKGAGRFGQFDLAGNLYEWTADAYGDTDEYASPSGCTNCANWDWSGNSLRVIKGGFYMSDASAVTAATRGSGNVSDYSFAVGFRCARVP